MADVRDVESTVDAGPSEVCTRYAILVPHVHPAHAAGSYANNASCRSTARSSGGVNGSTTTRSALSRTPACRIPTPYLGACTLAASGCCAVAHAMPTLHVCPDCARCAGLRAECFGACTRTMASELHLFSCKAAPCTCLFVPSYAVLCFLVSFHAENRVDTSGYLD